MPKRVIQQRELRNDVGAVLREVEAGATLRVTVRGKPVADLIPIPRRSDHFVPEEVRAIVQDTPLDSGFAADVASVAGATIDEL